MQESFDVGVAATTQARAHAKLLIANELRRDIANAVNIAKSSKNAYCILDTLREFVHRCGFNVHNLAIAIRKSPLEFQAYLILNNQQTPIFRYDNNVPNEIGLAIWEAVEAFRQQVIIYFNGQEVSFDINNPNHIYELSLQMLAHGFPVDAQL